MFNPMPFGILGAVDGAVIEIFEPTLVAPAGVWGSVPSGGRLRERRSREIGVPGPSMASEVSSTCGADSASDDSPMFANEACTGEERCDRVPAAPS